MLASLIETRRDPICDTLYVGCANWDKLLGGLRAAEAQHPDDFADEQVWTFLVAAAYGVAGRAGAESLSLILSEGQVHSERIWFEVLPLPPREREGNTNLDLAVGDLGVRAGTKSGIELSTGGRAICFCECKWYSDISPNVSFDRTRNQLARVVENALLFRNSVGQFAEEVHVTLITPAAFRRPRPWSRLYQYKWDDYRNRARILEDLHASRLRLRAGLPAAADRIDRLVLHWVTYEDLISGLPESELRAPLQEFFETARGAALGLDPAR